MEKEETYKMKIHPVFLVLAVCTLNAPSPAMACSCIVVPQGFVVPEGAKLPANAVGLPFVGGGRAENFEVVELRGKAEIPRSVRLLDVTQEGFFLGHPRGDGTWPVAVVAVEGGLRPGASYRFSLRATSKGDGYAVEQAVVTVSKTPLVVPPVVSLLVGPLEHGTVRIPAPGSCSREVESVRRDVAMDLPGLDETARNALSYLTLVGGRPWRRRASTCESLPVGPTWKGVARDLVFGGCPESSARALETRMVRIQMLGFLPGTDLVVRSEEVSADFACRPSSRSP
jgi:hypothetical protein